MANLPDHERLVSFLFFAKNELESVVPWDDTASLHLKNARELVDGAIQQLEGENPVFCTPVPEVQDEDGQ